MPPKGYEAEARPRRSRSSATRSSSISARSASELGYPLFMKPYDGGGWVGVSEIDDEEALRAAYEESGTSSCTCRRRVEPFDLFVRCIGVGPQMNARPLRPRRAAARALHRSTSTSSTDEDGSRCSRHDADDQRLLRLGLQLVRGAAQGRRSGTRSTSPTPAPTPRSRRCTATSRGWSRRSSAGRCSAPRRRGRCALNLDWEPFFEIADDGRCPTARSSRRTPRSPASASRPTRFQEFCAKHLPHLDEVAWEFFGTDRAKDAVRQKVAALFPAARGGAVHRALLAAHAGVARRQRALDVAERRGQDRRRAGIRSACERDVTARAVGTIRQPVLLFPTAGGDAEEIERFQMIDACGALLDAGRIKIYSSTASPGARCSPREGGAANRCGSRTSSSLRPP